MYDRNQLCPFLVEREYVYQALDVVDVKIPVRLVQKEGELEILRADVYPVPAVDLGKLQ